MAKKNLRPWVIFDGDNTLWSVENLYDAARHELCLFIGGMELDSAVVENFQQTRDAELHASYGYSACRFARSFEDTLLHFIPNAELTVIRHVRQLALNVFEQKARPMDTLVELIKDISPDFSLGIITAGERWVQERRLLDFHLRKKFQSIEIVESKCDSVFRAFCEKNHVDVANSWVIGDSVRSDIIPAKQAGLNAILFATNNWSHIEGHHQAAPPDIPVIHYMKDVIKVLRSL